MLDKVVAVAVTAVTTVAIGYGIEELFYRKVIVKRQAARFVETQDILASISQAQAHTKES